LPITAILDSGNRSIQGAVAVNASDLAEYKQRQAIVWEYFKDRHLDPGNKNPSRYFRCPEVTRNLYDKNHVLAGTLRQELLAIKVGAASWEEWEKIRGVNPTVDYTPEEKEQLKAEAMEFYRSKDRPLPLPMDETAYYGVAGQIVDIISAVSEPCRESLLAQFLVGFGSIMGRAVHCSQGGDHYLNEFVVLVGETAFGRKGTAWNAVRYLLKEIDPNWVKTKIFEGVQSGEAIVHEIRDSQQRLSPSGKTIYDPGVSGGVKIG
jgi:hypothetical protein